MKDKFTEVNFRNYKAFNRFSVTINEFNVLVGPNNSGKSTIIGAFRILSEGIKKASSRKAVPISSPLIKSMGHYIPVEDLPVAGENIFTNYDESEPAVIKFKLSSGNELHLVFPANNECYFVCNTKGKPATTPSEFKKVYPASISFVPILGPVEHNESLNQQDTARRALLSHNASRNFRNIWRHYPDEFDEFREMIRSTWPGMDIEKPEVSLSYEKPVLHMFCKENRYTREIFWAGFGFQVWCQMLTCIVKSKDDSLLIIDEPDIYLHSDLQRQLVEILRQTTSDILVATHSTEIISEVDPSDILVINKKGRKAKRIKTHTQLQSIFSVLGSNLNPTLTQLAKSKRAVFVEGKDFKVLSGLARKVGKQSLANSSDFAVIPVEGFNPERAQNFSKGIELTLGTKILKAVIFDRDYRTSEEVQGLLEGFEKFAYLAHIHQRKEIENYLLDPTVLLRAIEKKLEEKFKRSGEKISFMGNIEDILSRLSSKMKNYINAQFISQRTKFLRSTDPSLDSVTINEHLLEDFNHIWSSIETRLEIVPGKELLSSLNEFLQENYSISLTTSYIVYSMKKHEVPTEIVRLLEQLERFRSEPV